MNGFFRYSVFFFIIIFITGMIACGGGGGGDTGGVTSPTKQQLTEQDAANIKITYAGGNNISAVTENISLPDNGDNGSDITWTSNNATSLDRNGIVTRPAFGSGNRTVVLTATLVNGECTVTRDFVFTILEIPPTDSEAVAQAKSALEIGFAGSDDRNNVTQDITLITESFNDTEISWSSDNSGYITDDGDITQPPFSTGDQTVTLTATITRNGVSDTRSFILTVKTAPPADAEAVAQVKSSLSISYQNTDSASGVTLNVGLITSGSYNTTIEWVSSNEAYIGIYGNVTQPSYLTGDQNVTLTATITKGSESTTKQFDLVVIKKAISDIEAVSQDQASLTIGFSGTDTASNVTLDVILTNSGSNGTTITWSTNNSSHITSLGVVARPAYSTGDKSVTLTATITKNSVSQTKNFALTVIKLPPDTNAYLNSLTFTSTSGQDSSSTFTYNGNMAPAVFDPTILEYSCSIICDHPMNSQGTSILYTADPVQSVILNLTSASTHAVIQINFKGTTRTVTNGTNINFSASSVFNAITVGSNLITITVTAEDQTTSLVYHLSITGVERFTIYDANTIIDNKTNYWWQRILPTTKSTWQNAVSYCAGLTNSSYEDWKLPSQDELRTLFTAIVPSCRYVEYFQHYGFTLAANNPQYLWTSTDYSTYTTNALIHTMTSGPTEWGNFSKSSTNACPWAVRVPE